MSPFDTDNLGDVDVLSLERCEGKIYFKNIKLENLPLLLNLYNKVDDFMFATGVDSPVALEFLTQKYAEAAVCSNEFFSGIYLKQSGRMIGILKGRLQSRKNVSIWISSIAIEPEFQHMGYGSMTLNMLLDYLKVNFNATGVFLSVVEENSKGRAFWKKHNFREIRRIENYLRLRGRPRNVIIMHKLL